MLRPLKQLHQMRRWLFPSPAEKKFLRVMGWWFFFMYTVKREYPIKGFYADFAIPRRKVVFEVDGKEFHQDVVREWARDQAIIRAGWHLLHIPAERLWQHPKQVRKEVKLFARNPYKWQKLYGKRKTPSV